MLHAEALGYSAGRQTVVSASRCDPSIFLPLMQEVTRAGGVLELRGLEPSNELGAGSICTEAPSPVRAEVMRASGVPQFRSLVAGFGATPKQELTRCLGAPPSNRGGTSKGASATPEP
jgi:hypothetical protein